MTTKKTMAEIDTTNAQLVASQGDAVIVMMPKGRMTNEEALLHAAWLVAVAGGREKFLEILDAVEST